MRKKSNISEQIIKGALDNYRKFHDILQFHSFESLEHIQGEGKKVDSRPRKHLFVRTTKHSLLIGKGHYICTNFRLTFLNV